MVITDNDGSSTAVSKVMISVPDVFNSCLLSTCLDSIVRVWLQWSFHWNPPNSKFFIEHCNICVRDIKGKQNMCRNMLNYDNVGWETAWALVRRNNSNNSLRWESAPFKQKEIKEKKKKRGFLYFLYTGTNVIKNKKNFKTIVWFFYATFSGESE